MNQDRPLPCWANEDEKEPADLPVLEGESLAEFIAGIEEERAQMAAGKGISHEEAQREMKAYIASRIEERSRCG